MGAQREPRNDTKCPTAASLQSPEELGILIRVDAPDLPIGSNDLCFNERSARDTEPL